MTVHCSALRSDKGAVLIAGTPGAGKSSAARKLIEKGLRLMADDVAAARFENNECMIYPAFPFQKLCSNEIDKRGIDRKTLIYINEDKDKYLVPVRDIFESEPAKLRAFFYIIKGQMEELKIQKLTGFDCFVSIKDNLFLHKLRGDWETIPEVINLCMKIASSCPVYIIVRPEHEDTLDAITDKMMELLQD